MPVFWCGKPLFVHSILNYMKNESMNTSQLKKWMLLSFMVSGLMSCTQKEVTLGSLDVIPIPSEVVKLDDGFSFVIDGATKICYP